MAPKLEMNTAFPVRLFKWTNAIVTFFLTLITVFTGDAGAAVILFLSVLPSWALGTFYELGKMFDSVTGGAADAAGAAEGQAAAAKEAADEAGKKKKKPAAPASPVKTVM